MPIGIVSSSEFDEEANKLKISNSKSLIPQVIESNKSSKKESGRNEGDINVPNGLRNLIGNEAILNGRTSALELANQFGISASSVSAYTVGAKSTTTYEKRSNAPTIQKTKDIIGKRARRKLMDALNNITKEKLDNAKARDLASIAKDMAVVSKNMEPDITQGNIGNSPTFVFYTPQIRQENEFKIIRVKE